MSRGFVLPSTANSWSMNDIQRLQALVEARTSVREMARILRRTESSIRNKAALHGISLRGLLCVPGPT